VRPYLGFLRAMIVGKQLARPFGTIRITFVD
jgi:hypothetical protein